MALLKDYFQPQFEIVVVNCYWKIELENGIKGGKELLHVRMNCFKNKTVADTNQDKYADFDFEFVPDLNSEDNFIKQAYTYAKTLPEFVDAIDA